MRFPTFKPSFSKFVPINPVHRFCYHYFKRTSIRHVQVHLHTFSFNLVGYRRLLGPAARARRRVLYFSTFAVQALRRRPCDHLRAQRPAPRNMGTTQSNATRTEQPVASALGPNIGSVLRLFLTASRTLARASLARILQMDVYISKPLQKHRAASFLMAGAPWQMHS